MVLAPIILGSRGFQYPKGIVLIASWGRASFNRLFIHELTHWVLRKRPELEEKLAKGKFDALSDPVKGKVFPGYYAAVNKREYAAQMAVYAASNTANDDVITAEQRELITHEIFNAEPGGLSIPSLRQGGMDRGFFLYLSVMLHSSLIAYAVHSPYLKDISGYMATTAVAGLFFFALKAARMDKVGIKLVKLIKNYMKISVIWGTLVALTFSTVGLEKNLFWQGASEDIAIGFAKTRNEQQVINVNFFSGKPSDKKDDKLFDLREPDDWHIDIRAFEGKVPRVNNIPDEKYGIFNEVAQIYAFYGIERRPQDIRRTWTFLEQFKQDRDSWFHPRLRYRVEGKVVDGFRLHLIEGDLSKREHGIISALQKRHPVLHYGQVSIPTIIIGIKRMNSKHNLNKKSIEPFFWCIESKSKERILGDLVPILRDETKYDLLLEMVPVSVLEKERAKADQAMAALKGGIDLTSEKAMTVKNDGQGIRFHLDPARLAQLQNAAGFTVDRASIIIQPLGSLPAFLGLSQSQTNTQLAVTR
jgi:hypothetical protein